MEAFQKAFYNSFESILKACDGYGVCSKGRAAKQTDQRLRCDAIIRISRGLQKRMAYTNPDP
jgi:hypothetical protein